MGLFGSAHPQCSGPCQTALPKALWGQMDSLNQTVTKLQLRWDWISMIIWLTDNINLVIVKLDSSRSADTESPSPAWCDLGTVFRQTSLSKANTRVWRQAWRNVWQARPRQCQPSHMPEICHCHLRLRWPQTFVQLNMAIIINRTRDYWFLFLIIYDNEIWYYTLSIANTNMYSHGSNKEQVKMTNKGCWVMYSANISWRLLLKNRKTCSTVEAT